MNSQRPRPGSPESSSARLIPHPHPRICAQKPATPHRKSPMPRAMPAVKRSKRLLRSFPMRANRRRVFLNMQVTAGADMVNHVVLADPDELRAFFKGLRRIIASLGHGADLLAENEPAAAASRRAIGQRQVGQHQIGPPQNDDDREAVVAQAREKNAQAFLRGSRKNRRLSEDLNRERTCNTSRAHTNGHHVP
jgi:hypothetical protein